MVYGHVESAYDQVRHLRALTAIQAETGGFTEFIPMPWLPVESPVAVSHARPGPSLRESRAVHAVARLVLHGHITLNGRRTNIASAQVKQGDTVAVHTSSRNNEYFKTVSDTLTRKTVPRWLELDPNALSGRVSDRPTRQDIDINLNEALVVEYYSR